VSMKHATRSTPLRTYTKEVTLPKYVAAITHSTKLTTQLFYRTGSIYECDGRPCEPQDASATPTGAAPGTGATEASGEGVATGPGGDDHSASPAVSMSGLKTTVQTTATGTETGNSSEPAATDTGVGNGAGRLDWSAEMGVAAAMAWGAVAVL